MTAILRFKKSLQEHQIPEDIINKIFSGYENISDKASKGKKAAFFSEAIRHMDNLLEAPACQAVRDSCACSKGGWRLKAMQKIAREYKDESLERTLDAIGKVTYMGSPVINLDGTITAGIGIEGGFHCPCPIFDHIEISKPVSKTYCYCCAGHFRHHYQIALGKQLRTQAVLSSALASQGNEPCRFVFEIIN